MITTNDYGLPETIARAMIKQEQQYDAGQVDSSVTSLIQPARISLLRKLHFHEMTRDASANFWALLGSGVHYLLELGKTPDMIVEERLFMDIDGWRISGAIDVQQIRDNDIHVTDYKVTSTYSVKDGEPKEDWVAQLNLHTLLIEANKNMRVRSLTICAVLRDWGAEKAKADRAYPQAPIVMVPVPIWPKERQLEFARERVSAHRWARFGNAMGVDIAECTPEERWVRGDKWVVIKKGGKRALKTFTDETDAANLLEQKGDQYEMQHRPGKSLRCGYCGVSEFCDQYQRLISKEESDDAEAETGAD